MFLVGVIPSVVYGILALTPAGVAALPARQRAATTKRARSSQTLVPESDIDRQIGDIENVDQGGQGGR